MALIFCDGFDHYAAYMAGSTWYRDTILKKWSGQVQGQGFSSLSAEPAFARPPGGQGLKFGESNGHRGIFKTLPANLATFVVGFNFYLASSGHLNTGSPLFAVFDSASGVPATTTQLDVRGDGAGHIGVYRNGTLLGSISSNVLSLYTWYHLELKATINNTTGVYELRINGSSTGWVPEATGANTRGQSSNNWINVVALEGAGVNEIWYDDFYVLDTTGSVANSFIGPQKIVTIYPNAVGNSNQWTGNYASNFANVNEATGDGDQTFNQSNTAGHIDLFGFDDIPSGTISGIQHSIMARQDAGAARTFRPKTRISSTNYNGTTVTLPGSHQFLTEAVTLNPADSQAWETADINGAEFGYELVS